MIRRKALWRCPHCGRPFTNRNQRHSRVRVTVKEHLARAEPEVRRLYQEFEALALSFEGVGRAPVKTRIGFQARSIFAAAMLRKSWLDCHVVLARVLRHPRFRKIDSCGSRHVHHFRITKLTQVDREVEGWLREAYRVGLQEDPGRGRE